MMFALLGSVVLAAAPALMVELPGVRISQAHWLTGEPQSNIRVCDRDASAGLQLVLPTRIIQVDDGGAVSQIPLPAVEPPVWFEVLSADDSILPSLGLEPATGYVAARHRGGLTVWRRGAGDAWSEVWSGAWAWPDEALWPDQHRGLGSGLARTYLSSRAVWRVDPVGDVPLTSVFEVSPRLELPAKHDLFSPDRRFTAGLESVSALQLFEQDGAPAWVTRETRESSGARVLDLYRLPESDAPVRMPIPPGYSLFYPTPDPASGRLVSVTKPVGAARALPSVHREVRIASPDRPEDYLSWRFKDALAHRRAVSFCFVDADDRLDLVIQELEVAGPDPRESLARLTTDTSITVRVMVHLGGEPVFSAVPDIVHRVRIELLRPPAFQCARLRALLQGNLIAIAPVLATGEGPSHADLLVHGSPGSLAIHAGGDGAFAATPEVRMDVSEDARLRFLPKPEGGAWPIVEQTNEGAITTQLILLTGDTR